MSRVGETTVFVGAMGTGKTRLLCERYKKDSDEGVKVLAVKPVLDDREGDDEHIISRVGTKVPCIALHTLDEIFEMDLSGIEKIYIDEVQFFDDVYEIECIFDLNMKGIDVEAYGLDLNSYAETFGEMGLLMARADSIFKVSNKCPRCKTHPIRFTAREGSESDEIIVGDLDMYTPLCKPCYKEVMIDKVDKVLNEQILEKYGHSFPHSHLENVTMLEEGKALIELGDKDSDFHAKIIVDEAIIGLAGWTLEDVADIIDPDALMRLIEEMESLKYE